MRLWTRVQAAVGIIRVPRVGDPVWFASKQAQCLVTRADSSGVIVFQGGPLVRRPSGRIVARWTVTVRGDSAHWDDGIGAWVVGHGPVPKNVRGTVITPDPVNASIGTQPGKLL